MRKIDTSGIEGYAEMTPEQKVAALEGYTIPDPDLTGYVKKDVLDKATHDAADWKKKYNSTRSESEKAGNDYVAQIQQMQTQLDQLTKEKTVSGYTANLVANGYSAELAAETAQAMADGDTDKFFANMKTFLSSYAADVRAENMKNTPRPPVGSDVNTPDYNQMAMKAMEEGNHAMGAYYFQKAAEQGN